MNNPICIFVVIILAVIYAPQAFALEPDFIRDNMPGSFKGTFGWNVTSEVLFSIWLISIPIISLIVLNIKKQSEALRIWLVIGIFYNSAAFLILIGTAGSAGEAHPVAFAILDQIFLFFMAVIAVANAVAISNKFNPSI